MKITTEIQRELSEKEQWEVSVCIEREEPETIHVQMNTDTIVCTLDGYGFKTYQWISGDVELEATSAACKYLAYCDNQ